MFALNTFQRFFNGGKSRLVLYEEVVLKFFMDSIGGEGYACDRF